MTAQVLVAELSNLIQESKRKHNDLRNAAEKSLQDLRALPWTSEAQLAADLGKRPYFAAPFFQACGTRNAKLVNPAVTCLHRLVVCRGLPKDSLKQTLEAFIECSTLGLDIQLKILQSLPPLLQQYSSELRSEVLFGLLQVCSTLQNVKTPAVSGIAAATLQQIVTFTFDKVVAEDAREFEIPTVAEVPGDDKPISVRSAAHDAYRIFHDLCSILEDEKPTFIRFSYTSRQSGLELVESLIQNHADLFLSHPEMGRLLRTRILPLVAKSLSERLAFPMSVRVFRVLDVVIRNCLAITTLESEICLGLMNRTLEPDPAVPWKRVLCMELLRGFFADPNVVLDLCATFDGEDGRVFFVRDMVSSFVRIASEKPLLIGLGQESSSPAGDYSSQDVQAEQAAVEAGGVAGVIGGAVGTRAALVPGISSQLSSVRASCLDQLDKTEPPALPETYLYSLVLIAINNLAESLARFILPLTVQSEGRSRKKVRARGDAPGSDPINSGSETRQAETSALPQSVARTLSYRKKTVPINPLSLENHPSFSGIQAVENLISECWPGILATYATFLYAALDSDYYHALVRAFQKFTQVAGLLRLSTPRDAFLTTLGKAAVPSKVLTATISSPNLSSADSPTRFGHARSLLGVDTLVGQASGLTTDAARRQSLDVGPQPLSSRNMLCLRALLNLAIALGPTLEGAWTIIFETLQQADIIIAFTGTKLASRPYPQPGHQGEHDTSSNQSLGVEVAAVQAAALRLFESTVDFPHEAFVRMLESLCALLHDSSAPRTSNGQAKVVPRPSFHQRRVGSFSGSGLNSDSQDQDHVLALRKIGNIANLNSSRFIGPDHAETGWEVLIEELISVATNGSAGAVARHQAAHIISQITVKIAESIDDSEPELTNVVQCRVLSALAKEIATTWDAIETGREADYDINLEVHDIALEALRTIVEKCGDSLSGGWAIVFTIILSVFGRRPNFSEIESLRAEDEEVVDGEAVRLIATRLGRSAFASMQLICSDFLASTPLNSIQILIDALYRFCLQEDDLNVTLTSITFFWNLSDILHSRITPTSLESTALSISHKDSQFAEVKSAAQQKSPPGLWFYLLHRLTTVTADERSEVRNGAVYTILRIFDSYGAGFSVATWEYVVRAVLYRVLRIDIKKRELERQQQGHVSGVDTAAKNETTKIALEGISNLFANYLDAIIQSPEFDGLWEDLVRHFEAYVRYDLHELNATVYSALAAILLRVSNRSKLGSSAVDRATSFWCDFVPRGSEKASRGEDEAASLAYVRSWKQIYRLIGSGVDTELIETATTNLGQCIRQSRHLGYTSDIDTMTELQSQVTAALKEIHTEVPGVPSVLIKILAKFVSLPYSIDPEKSTEAQTPTFMALSKASTDHLLSLIAKVSQQREIYDNDALLAALAGLNIPIKWKFNWRVQGKPPVAWQKATSAVLAILTETVLKAKDLSIDAAHMRSIWEQVAKLFDAIARADCTAASANTDLLGAESFDLAALETMRELITPALGESTISDSIRRAYASALFRNSLIHCPTSDELPTSDAEPLKNLYEVRFGRTYDPPPTQRPRVAYFCLTELLRLIARSDTGGPRVRLAQAAAPFLIARAALTIKTYIADQQLRGRLPQPASQRAELLFLLRKLRELQSDERAIPECEGVKSSDKRHLHRLFPLVTKALAVAGGDAEILEELRLIVEVVGDGFGL